MTKQILVVVAEPKQPARTVTIENDLESLQALVNGSIEMLRVKEFPALHLYVNEDGKVKLPININLGGLLEYRDDTIVGTIVVSRTDNDGEEIGLGERTAEHVIRWLDNVRSVHA